MRGTQSTPASREAVAGDVACQAWDSATDVAIDVNQRRGMLELATAFAAEAATGGVGCYDWHEPKLRPGGADGGTSGTGCCNRQELKLRPSGAGCWNQQRGMLQVATSHWKKLRRRGADHTTGRLRRWNQQPLVLRRQHMQASSPMPENGDGMLAEVDEATHGGATSPRWGGVVHGRGREP